MTTLQQQAYLPPPPREKKARGAPVDPASAYVAKYPNQRIEVKGLDGRLYRPCEYKSKPGCYRWVPISASELRLRQSVNTLPQTYVPPPSTLMMTATYPTTTATAITAPTIPTPTMQRQQSGGGGNGWTAQQQQQQYNPFMLATGASNGGT